LDPREGRTPKRHDHRNCVQQLQGRSQHRPRAARKDKQLQKPRLVGLARVPRGELGVADARRHVEAQSNYIRTEPPLAKAGATTIIGVGCTEIEAVKTVEAGFPEGHSRSSKYLRPPTRAAQERRGPALQGAGGGLPRGYDSRPRSRRARGGTAFRRRGQKKPPVDRYHAGYQAGAFFSFFFLFFFSSSGRAADPRHAINGYSQDFLASGDVQGGCPAQMAGAPSCVTGRGRDAGSARSKQRRARNVRGVRESTADRPNSARYFLTSALIEAVDTSVFESSNGREGRKFQGRPGRVLRIQGRRLFGIGKFSPKTPRRAGIAAKVAASTGATRGGDASAGRLADIPADRQIATGTCITASLARGDGRGTTTEAVHGTRSDKPPAILKGTTTAGWWHPVG